MHEHIKPYAIMIIASIAALINPILNVVIVLTATFLFNIAVGIATDIHINKISFNLKKAFGAFVQMTLLVMFVYYLHGVLSILGLQKIGSEVIKWIAILAVYFYSTNILRNLTIMFPRNKLFSFIYEIMTTQVFARIKAALMMNFK